MVTKNEWGREGYSNSGSVCLGIECSNIYPANLIRLAYSRYEYFCANTIGVVLVSSYLPKFAALRLFVETMPVPLVSLCSTCQREKV
jgi:hypothetical protein